MSGSAEAPAGGVSARVTAPAAGTPAHLTAGGVPARVRAPSGGAPGRLTARAGGARHLRRTALTVLALAVLVAVGCALLAPGSREVRTTIGDLPAWPQDEARIAAEVWFTLALGAVAVLGTLLWWRPLRRAPGQPGDADPVQAARGPVGLAVAAVAAVLQTGVAMLAWRAVVALRGFPGPGAIGDDRIAAPVLSSTTPMWVAGVCAVITYLVLVILAPSSALVTSAVRREPDADEVRSVSPGSRRGGPRRRGRAS